MPPPRTADRDAAVLAHIRAAATHADPSPQLPLAELAAHLGVSVDTARRAIRRLEHAGSLRVIPQIDAHGGGGASRYLPTDSPARAPETPPDDAPAQPVRSRAVSARHTPVVDRCAR